MDFRVADARFPARLSVEFGAIVDCGFYHLFDPEQSEGFVDELARALRTGGRLYLCEFAVQFSIPNVPRQVTEEEIRERFTSERGWRLLTVRSGQFMNRVAPVPATLACIERDAPT